MHDIRFIRENPAAFDAGLKRRGLAPRASEILALDEKARGLTTRLQDLQTKRNAASKAIGAAKAKKDEDEAARLMAEVEAVKQEMPRLEAEEAAEKKKLDDILASIPNLPADDVPDGADEHGNVEARRWGEPRRLNNAKEHFDIGEALGMMDFETAAKMSGARFVLLSGALARMERAIANLMLDTHTEEFGYTECVPPVLVRDMAPFGVGQLPKFEEDLFRTTNGYWLTSTAEVTLSNIVADCIVDEDYLPRRYTAWTPCFRSEAGAAGKDTRGMIRMHQFSKVELVSITTPEKSTEEHERMTACAEAILKKLDLSFRTMALCTGDMGFASRKTYDIEVWLPGQNKYREISSCSNCGDFQARRMKARYRPKPGPGGHSTTPLSSGPISGGKVDAPRFVHTLNGSGLAVGRTLVAILENYQQADGSVAVPAALQGYMGGMTVIGK